MKEIKGVKKMKKTSKIVAIAILASVLNFSQSHAYFSETGWDMSWHNFKATAAAGETTRKYYTGEGENRIKYECIFDNNKNGVCKKFYKNGHLANEKRSTGNGKHAAYKTFFQNGELSSEGHFTNDEKNGLFKQYYWRSASALSRRQVSSESSYRGGYPYGLYKEYSPNGTVTWSQNYN